MNQLVMSVLWLAGLGLAVPPEYSYGPYNEGRMDPQLEGWPLTAEERAYVVKRVEHNRRPGRESLKHLPKWLFGANGYSGPSICRFGV